MFVMFVAVEVVPGQESFQGMRMGGAGHERERGMMREAAGEWR